MINKIGIIGSSGLIGSALKKQLNKFEIIEIPGRSLYESPDMIAQRIENIDVIINLAGYSINGRWTRKRKELIYVSRVKLTENLVKAIALLKEKPIQLVNASAIGIYNDGAILDEASIDYADNPLARLVKEWEGKANEVKKLSVRLTIIRTGIVLSRNGGAYKMLKRIIKMGLGGIIGSGKQGYSFILLDDLVRAIELIINNQIEGIVNLVCPEPVDNKTFIKEMAKKLNRPAIFTVPGFVIKALFSEGSVFLLKGQKVLPGVLIKNNFKFVGNNLKSCLDILEK
jgi:uncharacterized protein (TIGR01777 family)